MDKPKEMRPPVMLFYSYASEDQRLRDQLEKHLILLQRQSFITMWHKRQIVPGSDWASTIDRYLETAGVILLLISPDFLASEYLYGREMQYALKRADAGQVVVIPVILRPCDWKNALFTRFQSLPRNDRAVTLWENEDAAYLDIVEGIREVVERFSPAVNKAFPALPPKTSQLIPDPSHVPVFSEHLQNKKLLENQDKVPHLIIPPTALPGMGAKPVTPKDSPGAVPWQTGFQIASPASKWKQQFMIILTTLVLLLLVALSIVFFVYIMRSMHL